jgi:hypothetical protein
VLAVLIQPTPIIIGAGHIRTTNERSDKATREGGQIGANKNFKRELDLCPKLNSTYLSSNLVKTA